MAERILKQKKKQISKKGKATGQDGRIVIDLNVNVSGLK